MSIDNFLTALSVCGLMAFGAFLLVVGQNIILSECAKEHNVYACEFIAVPKTIKSE